MFWRFGFNNISSIQTAIDKEGATMDQIIGEEQLLQEVKDQNEKLIKFICLPQNLEIMLSYVVNFQNLEESVKFKYPYLAGEIVACEVQDILSAIVKQEGLLANFWKLLDAPSLVLPAPIYFFKINAILLMKQTGPMMEFLRQNPENAERILKHLSNPVTIEFIMKLINAEEMVGGIGAINVSYFNQWLKEIGLIEKLFSFMDPSLDPELPVGINPETGEQLPSGSTQLLVSEMKREIEIVEAQQHEFTINNQAAGGDAEFPGMHKVKVLAVELNDIFIEFSEKLKMFAELLDSPPTNLFPFEYQLSSPVTLGSERLKVCELFAEFIHLQYLFTSSPLFDLMIDTTADLEFTIAEGLMTVTNGFIDEGIMERCIAFFFNFPWNNFIHSVIYDMIAKIFNTYSFITNIVQSQENPSNLTNSTISSKLSQKKIREIQSCAKVLVVNIFKKCQLIDRILDAQRLNDYEEVKPKGMRRGYMGHLTYIADETCKLFDKCSEELGDEINVYIKSESWNEYVTHALRQTQENDRLILGGAKPEAGNSSNAPKLMGDEDLKNFGGNFVTTIIAKEDDDKYDNSNMTGDTFQNDQFARYLCQQMVKDLPDRFLGADSSDEEDGRWIGNLDDAEVEYDIGQAISSDNILLQQGGGDDSLISDDEDSLRGEKDENDIHFREFEPSLTSELGNEQENAGWAEFPKVDNT